MTVPPELERRPRPIPSWAPTARGTVLLLVLLSVPGLYGAATVRDGIVKQRVGRQAGTPCVVDHTYLVSAGRHKYGRAQVIVVEGGRERALVADVPRALVDSLPPGLATTVFSYHPLLGQARYVLEEGLGDLHTEGTIFVVMGMFLIASMLFADLVVAAKRARLRHLLRDGAAAAGVVTKVAIVRRGRGNIRRLVRYRFTTARGVAQTGRAWAVWPGEPPHEDDEVAVVYDPGAPERNTLWAP